MPEMNYKELPVDETSIVPTESEKGQESGHDVADFEKLFQAYFSKKPEKALDDRGKPWYHKQADIAKTSVSHAGVVQW